MGFWLMVLAHGRLCNSSVGASARPPESDYLVDVWGTEQGLPNATVSGIAQTPDGYLWCGTYDGVVRFDEVRFVRVGLGAEGKWQNFNPRNGASINRDVRALFEDREGNLWVGTGSAGTRVDFDLPLGSEAIKN